MVELIAAQILGHVGHRVRRVVGVRFPVARSIPARIVTLQDQVEVGNDVVQRVLLLFLLFDGRCSVKEVVQERLVIFVLNVVSTHHLKQLPPSGPAGQEGVDVLVSRCDLVDRPGEEQGVSGHRQFRHLYRGAGVGGIQTESEQGAWWLPNTTAVERCPTTLNDGG